MGQKFKFGLYKVTCKFLYHYAQMFKLANCFYNWNMWNHWLPLGLRAEVLPRPKFSSKGSYLFASVVCLYMHTHTHVMSWARLYKWLNWTTHSSQLGENLLFLARCTLNAHHTHATLSNHTCPPPVFDLYHHLFRCLQLRGCANIMHCGFIFLNL